MDPIPGFRDKLAEYKNRVTNMEPGDSPQQLLADFVRQLFEAQYRHPYKGDSNFVLAATNAVLERYPEPPKQPGDLESMVHHVLYLMAVVNEWPVGVSIEYDQRIRLTRRW